MRVCGIDPGNKGAMCVLDSTDLTYIALLDLDKSSIYTAAKWLHNQQVDVIYLEDVHSLYGMSAKSNFNFGKNLGVVSAIAEIIKEGSTPKLVTPKVWQKFIGVNTKGKQIKHQVAAIALSLYPTANLRGKRGGLLDGRSDSLMIAHYGLQKETT